MKKYGIPALLLVGAAFLSTPAAAQVSSSPDRFSPAPAGFVERAREMLGAGNFTGVLDQLGFLAGMPGSGYDNPRTADDAEECGWLLAEALAGLGDARCADVAADFLRRFPSSPFAPRVAAAAADALFFNHEWPDALLAYERVNFNALPPARQSESIYRKSVCLIRTGHFREARSLLSRLRGKKGYADAYNFYSAYLDYIEGDFTKAYKRFADVAPGEKGLEAGYYMAQIEFSRGQYADVISRGRSLLSENPVPDLCAEINRIVGLSCFKLGEYPQARRYLTQYLGLTADNPSPDALYALGAIAYADRDYAGAENIFRKIPAGSSPDIMQGAQLYLGQCALASGDASRAAIAFEKAARADIDPKVTETALYNYVTALTRGGNVPFSSAAKLLQEFSTRFPHSPHAASVEEYLAAAYYNERKYGEALRSIASVSRPSAALLAIKQKALYEQGVEQLTNGRRQQAAESLRAAVAMGNAAPGVAAQASLWLGDALYSLGNYREASRSYETFLRAEPRSQNAPLARYNLAYALYKQKDYRNAAKQFRQALSGHPALAAELAADATTRRADCLYYVGAYSEALAAYSDAIARDGADADYATYRRAVLYGLSGDHRRKIEELSLLEKRWPNSRWLSKAMLEKALAYEETGKSDEAAESYRRRLEASQQVSTDELIRMAETMHKAGRWRDLLDVTSRIRAAGGLDADELADIDLLEADASAALRNWQHAEELYSQTARNFTSLAGSKAAVALGERYLTSGRTAEAEKLMTEFTDAGSPHEYWLARGYIVLADALAARGSKAAAREYLESLKENYPGTESDIIRMIDSRLNKLKK